MARIPPVALAAVLVLGACNSDPRPPAPPVDLGPREGLAFPDLVRSGDRGTTDRPAPSDRRTEKPGPLDSRADRIVDHKVVDLAPPDQKIADLSSSPCFYDWSNWSCTSSVFSFGCTGTCGGILQIKCSALTLLCSCTKSGKSHTCATPGGPTCAPCQAAMKAGCCNF